MVRHTKTLNFLLLFPAFTAQLFVELLFVELLERAAGGGFLQINTGLSENDIAVTKPASRHRHP
ncbi:MAG: hypothetical protein ACJATP_003865 [Candidatus Azotimanducaceae bacterium]